MEAARLEIHGPASPDVLAATAEIGLEGHLFRTSGTTSGPKWVHLTREAVEASAHQVNAHLGVSKEDSWVCALPKTHVGGYMISERALRSGSQVFDYQGKWDAGRCVSLIEEVEGSLISLVPTQIVDLVTAGEIAPKCLRRVIVGGAALLDETYVAASELGWPIIRSYGMTETCSQVATEAFPGAGDLHILPEWEARTSDSGILSLRGAALFSGYVTDGGCYQPSGQWFDTSDRVRLEGQALTFLQRSNRAVKILGEWVNLSEVEKSIGQGVVVVTVPDDRAGNRLVAVSTESIDLGGYNARVAGYERVTLSLQLAAMPTTDLGKVSYLALETLVKESCLKSHVESSC